MIRHVVLLRFQEGTTAEQVAAIGASLDAFAASLGLTGYVHGPDAGLGAPRFDYAIVGDFATEDEWRSYDTHPEHVPVRACIAEVLAERAVIQLRLG